MRKNNPYEFNRGNHHERRRMFFEKGRERRYFPSMPDYGLQTVRSHTPSSGFSYSDADEYENRKFMNPNVDYVPDEPIRDTTGRWSRDYQSRSHRRFDDRISDLVHDVLSKHPDIDVGQIRISTHDGVVTLKGRVETRRLKRLIEDVVYGLPDVEDVQNRIQVDPPPREARRFSHRF